MLRIGLGCLLLLDLAIRFPDISAFYVADGVCPVDSMPHSHWTMKHLELYRLADTSWAVASLFFLAAVAAVCLLLGFHSRTAAAVSWYLLSSLQNRNIYINDGGDLLMRVALLFCIFLPLGARWSMDASRHPEWRAIPNRYFSWATVALTVQVCVMYFTAGVLKSDESWRVSGDALYLALSLDQFTTAFGQSLLAHPQLLRTLNFMVLALEICAPLLLLCPFYHARVRCLGLALLAAFHLGIASCMHLGLFIPVCLVVLLGLLPTSLLDRWMPPAEPAATLPERLPSGYALSRPARAFLGVCVAFLLIQNAVTVPETGMVARGQALQTLLTFGRSTALMQNWTLFAPRPQVADGWFVVVGTRQDGSTVDLLSGASPATYAKPALVSAQFVNQRWRRHFQNLFLRYNPKHVPLYLRWVGQRWNQQNSPEDKLTSVRLVFVQELTQLPGIPQPYTPYSWGDYPSRWLPGELK